MKNHETTGGTQAAGTAAPAVDVATAKATAMKAPGKTKGAAKGKKTAQGAKAKAGERPKKSTSAKTVTTAPKAGKPTAESKLPRDGSKLAQVITLISKKGGATLEALMVATDWQAHTIRGLMSTLTRRTGVEFTSTRRESDKTRVYEVVR
jgi:Protein of unknown function (DUF3489)